MVRAALLAALVLVGACSSRFLYNKVDWLIVWKVQSYVSLSNAQEQFLKTDIQAYLDQARANDLPRLAELLDRTARDIEAGVVTPDMIDARYAEVFGRYDEFMLGIVPLSERFLQGLSLEQVEELSASFDETNDEMYEKYSGRTSAEREKNRNEAAIKGTERFTGRLQEEQRQLIRDTLTRMEDASEEWVGYQREWQQRFRQLIISRPEGRAYTDELTLLFVYPGSLHSAEYRRRVEANRVIFNAMLAELLTGLSAGQRAYMVEKLRGYAELINKLTG
jgi:hypothetical protein